MASIKQINATTFSAEGFDDVKPVVEIGGKDKTKFIPNLNASYFDDEFYFNLNRKGTAAVELTTNDKAQIVGDDTDDFYIDDSGRLKWDVIFKECPKSLTLEWELKHTDGIDFFYQGELTEEEIKDGCIRPDEVIGSYAVYCNKANNKYKTGKLCHIYRPFVIDADGAREWATLLIEKGTLTISLPEKFMDSAKYPVRLDPTFGNTGAGASTLYLYDGDGPRGSTYGAYAATAGQIITKYTAYCAGVSGATTMAMAAYTVSSGDLSSRLGSATSISIANTTAAWRDSADIEVEMASATYGMAAGCYGIGNIILYYDTDYGDNYHKRNNGTELLPSSWTTNATYAQRISMYATYGEGGGDESSVPAIINHLRNQGVL